MSPPLPPAACRHRSTMFPILMEELVEEILIRIPPVEPAHLARAALVCKPWRRIILSDPGFLRRYRTFHRRPPLLGFFSYTWHHGFRPSFAPVAAALPSQLHHLHRRAWDILDCRHGRVLVKHAHDDTIIVWDPISDDRQELPRGHGMYCCESYCAAVLCAVAGCDHYDCRGGPFRVVYIETEDIDDTILHACVYSSSSEPHAWASYQLDRGCHFGIHRAAVIGDEVYFFFWPGFNIVKYDLVKRSISLLISSPPNVGKYPPVLTQNEDGSLGLASIRDSGLYLWSSRMVNHDRSKLVVEWIQERVIELDKILPSEISINKDGAQVYVSGFAEGLGILFICTFVGTFTIELKSRRVRKITQSRDLRVLPFITFFDPSEAIGHSSTSAERLNLL